MEGDLLPVLQAATALEVLEKHTYQCPPENAALLAPALRGLTQLRQLQLSLTQPESTPALASALLQLTGLTHLDLDSSRPESIAALAPTLQHLTGLREL
jgi:hypothetical protein